MRSRCSISTRVSLSWAAQVLDLEHSHWRVMTYAINRTEQNNQNQRMMFRSPKRISITIPYNAYEHLLRQSDLEGRSLSNLAAFLLESAIGKRVDRG
jgi:hypothetical protein